MQQQQQVRQQQLQLIMQQRQREQHQLLQQQELRQRQAVIHHLQVWCDSSVWYVSWEICLLLFMWKCRQLFTRLSYHKAICNYKLVLPLCFVYCGSMSWNHKYVCVLVVRAFITNVSASKDATIITITIITFFALAGVANLFVWMVYASIAAWLVRSRIPVFFCQFWMLWFLVALVHGDLMYITNTIILVFIQTHHAAEGKSPEGQDLSVWGDVIASPSTTSKFSWCFVLFVMFTFYSGLFYTFISFWLQEHFHYRSISLVQMKYRSNLVINFSAFESSIPQSQKCATQASRSLG